MASLITAIRTLVRSGIIRISDHGYEELANDDILVRDVISGCEAAVVIQEYPDYQKGPCVLVLEIDRDDKPIHVVWGIPRQETEPAVLVTAYRPDPATWESDYLRRKA